MTKRLCKPLFFSHFTQKLKEPQSFCHLTFFIWVNHNISYIPCLAIGIKRWSQAWQDNDINVALQFFTFPHFSLKGKGHA